VSELYERAPEEVHERAESNPDPWARGVAVLVSFLAAALALTGIAEKSSQNEYLSAHIAVSDDWSFYQAKDQRAAIRASEASILQSLPNAADPEIQKRIQAAEAYIAHARDDTASNDGMKQLAARAAAREGDRQEALERYHRYELASGALELAIVLASVSVVIRIRPLTMGAGALGLVATLGAIAVRLGLF
jgi:Domain of unknown function (DUF4337)